MGEHIKQMANLCNTVGVEKFASLSSNILKSIKTVLDGGKFELDFAPLLQQQPQNDDEKTPTKTENKSVPKATKSKSIKKKKKKRIKSSVSVSASSSTSKSKSKQKSKKKITPKAKSEEQVIKAKRAYYSHGASISCSECDMCPIRGARFVCMIRENYNLCEECENKLVNEQEQYPMIKIFKPRANWHIKNFKGLQDLVAIPQIEEVLQISGNVSTTTSIKAQAPSQEEESKTSTNSVP